MPSITISPHNPHFPNIFHFIFFLHFRTFSINNFKINSKAKFKTKILAIFLSQSTFQFYQIGAGQKGELGIAGVASGRWILAAGIGASFGDRRPGLGFSLDSINIFS